MTEELKLAIENLYSTFSTYAFNSTMEGCPCCVSNTDKEKIHSKKLRELTEVDLSRYTAKAMTTWGDENDYKHYLPRIFELLSTTDFIVSTFIVLGKLEYGQWKTWKENEQVAIKKFLFAWWTDLVKNKNSFDYEAFIEVLKLTDNIDEFLKLWTIDFDNYSFANYVEFVYTYYNDLNSKRTEFRELSEVTCDKLLTWINDNSNNLEKGFYEFADKDKDFAERISITQYIFERT